MKDAFSWKEVFNKVQFTNSVPFMVKAFSVLLKKSSYLPQGHEAICVCSSRILTVLPFTFRSVTHHKLIFVHGGSQGSKFIFPYKYPVALAPFIEKIIPSHTEFHWCPFCKSGSYACVSLFLDSVFYSVGLFVYYCTIFKLKNSWYTILFSDVQHSESTVTYITKCSAW